MNANHTAWKAREAAIAALAQEVDALGDRLDRSMSSSAGAAIRKDADGDRYPVVTPAAALTHQPTKADAADKVGQCARMSRVPDAASSGSPLFDFWRYHGKRNG